MRSRPIVQALIFIVAVLLQSFVHCGCAVLFKDDDPKKGFVTLILTIPHMAVKRSVFRKLQPSNGIVNVKFDTGSVWVHEPDESSC